MPPADNRESVFQPLVESQCRLGEGPVWLPETGTLFWTDIEGQRLWRWSEGEGAAPRPLIAPAGALARGEGGTLLAPMARGFARIDPDTGAATALADPLASPEGTLMNDGKCDRRGRLIGGSKHLAESAAEGVAFVLERGALRVLRAGFTVFNGPAFSPAGDRIYFADSPSQRIMTAAYDLEAGTMGEPEVFAALGKDEGYPDGMTVDAAGALWSARWDGWTVARYTPDGALDRVFEVPVPRPTSLTFGGAGMDTLFVTSARTRLDEAALAAAPLSGALFVARVGHTGLAEPIYRD